MPLRRWAALQGIKHLEVAHRLERRQRGAVAVQQRGVPEHALGELTVESATRLQQRGRSVEAESMLMMVIQVQGSECVWASPDSPCDVAD